MFGGDKVMLTASSSKEEKMCCCSYRAGAITVACVYLVLTLAAGGFFTYLTAVAYDPSSFGVYCALAVLQFLAAVFHVVLLVGAVKRNHKAILAWVIAESITIGLILGGVILNLFTGNVHSLWNLVTVLIRGYLLRAISVYYKEVKQQTQSPPPYTQEKL